MAVTWDGAFETVAIDTATEARTIHQSAGNNPGTYHQTRAVKLATKVRNGFDSSCPRPSVEPVTDQTASAHDTENTNGNPGSPVYDSRTEWNPVTHKVTETVIVRISHTAWRNESFTPDP